MHTLALTESYTEPITMNIPSALPYLLPAGRYT